MTLKIEHGCSGGCTVFRFFGRIRASHLEELKAQVKSAMPTIVLDLDEVTLVDVEVIRFLGLCEAEGIEIIHSPLYIREWISRERGRHIASRI